MSDVTLTVPAELGPRFEHESEFAARVAADNLAELVRLEGRNPRATPEAIAEVKARVRHAEHLRETAGEERVTADRDALEYALAFCLLDAADDVKGASEGLLGSQTRAEVRAAIAEVETWLELLDELDLDEAPELIEGSNR